MAERTSSRRIVVIGGGAAGIGAAGAAKGTDPDAEIIVYTEYRGRRLQPVRHPLRARQGDPRLRAAVPRHQAAVRRPGHRHPLRDAGERRRHRRPRRPRRRRPAGAVRRADRRHRLGLRPPDVPGGDLGRHLLHEEHPRGDGVGQGPRRGQERRRRSRPSRSAWRWSPPCATAASRPTWSTPARGRCRWPRDPDIVAPVQESWVEMGGAAALQHQARGDPRRRAGQVRGVADVGRRDRLPTWSSSRTHKVPQHRPGRGRRAQGRLGRRVHRRRDRWPPRCRASGRPATASRSRTAVSHVPHPGPVRQPRLRAGQGRRASTPPAATARLPAGLRALGHGRRQVDDRRRLVQRDPRRRRWASPS